MPVDPFPLFLFVVSTALVLFGAMRGFNDRRYAALVWGLSGFGLIVLVYFVPIWWMEWRADSAAEQFGVAEAHMRRPILTNYSAASHWYERAATGGHVQSQFEIGHDYLYGHGVQMDRERARVWLTRAADAGHEWAYDDLAEFPE